MPGSSFLARTGPSMARADLTGGGWESRDRALRLDRAVALAPDARRAIVDAFFAAHPGAGHAAPGLGRAVGDFVDWQVDSGRLGAGGSPWWRAVNGWMMLDLADSGAGRTTTPATARWHAYSRAGDRDGDAQRLLWRAHQQSLHAALVAARPLLDSECDDERRFVAVVLRVVDGAAAAGSDTAGPDLRDLTRRWYPARYPACAADLETLAAIAPGAR